jgi:hypothetical protein
VQRRAPRPGPQRISSTGEGGGASSRRCRRVARALPEVATWPPARPRPSACFPWNRPMRGSQGPGGRLGRPLSGGRRARGSIATPRRQFTLRTRALDAGGR